MNIGMKVQVVKNMVSSRVLVGAYSFMLGLDSGLEGIDDMIEMALSVCEEDVRMTITTIKEWSEKSN